MQTADRQMDNGQTDRWRDELAQRWQATYKPADR